MACLTQAGLQQIANIGKKGISEGIPLPVILKGIIKAYQAENESTVFNSIVGVFKQLSEADSLKPDSDIYFAKDENKLDNIPSLFDRLWMFAEFLDVKPRAKWEPIATTDEALARVFKNSGRLFQESYNDFNNRVIKDSLFSSNNLTKDKVDPKLKAVREQLFQQAGLDIPYNAPFDYIYQKVDEMVESWGLDIPTFDKLTAKDIRSLPPVDARRLQAAVQGLFFDDFVELYYKDIITVSPVHRNNYSSEPKYTFGATTSIRTSVFNEDQILDAVDEMSSIFQVLMEGTRIISASTNQPTSTFISKAEAVQALANVYNMMKTNNILSDTNKFLEMFSIGYKQLSGRHLDIGYTIFKEYLEKFPDRDAARIIKQTMISTSLESEHSVDFNTGKAETKKLSSYFTTFHEDIGHYSEIDTYEPIHSYMNANGRGIVDLQANNDIMPYEATQFIVGDTSVTVAKTNDIPTKITGTWKTLANKLAKGNIVYTQGELLSDKFLKDVAKWTGYDLTGKSKDSRLLMEQLQNMYTDSAKRESLEVLHQDLTKLSAAIAGTTGTHEHFKKVLGKDTIGEILDIKGVMDKLILATDYVKGRASKSTMTNIQGNQMSGTGLANYMHSFNRDFTTSVNPAYAYNQLFTASDFVVRGGVAKDSTTKASNKFNIAEILTYDLEFGYADQIAKNLDGRKEGDPEAILLDFDTMSDKKRHPLAVIHDLSLPMNNKKGIELFTEDRDKYIKTVSEAHRDSQVMYYDGYGNYVIDAFSKAFGTKFNTVAAVNKHLLDKKITPQMISDLATSAGVSLAVDNHYVINDDVVTVQPLIQKVFDSYAKPDKYNDMITKSKGHFYGDLVKNNVRLGSTFKKLSDRLLGDSTDRFKSANLSIMPVIVEDDGSLTPHPLIEKYFYDWNLYAENLTNATLGSVIGFKGKTLEDKWSGRTKRNVSYQSSYHKPVLGLKKGLNVKTKTAYIGDLEKDLVLIKGDKTKQEVHDGVTFILPSLFNKLKYSLNTDVGGLDPGKILKTFGTEHDKNSFTFKILKHAEFRLSNDRIRRSVKDSSARTFVNLGDQVKRMLEVNELDPDKDYSMSLHKAPSRSYILDKDHGLLSPIRLDKVGNTYRVQYSSSKGIIAKDIPLNNMHDVWQAFGGKDSLSETPVGVGYFSIDGRSLDYGDSSWDVLYEFETEFDDLNGGHIERLANNSGSKSGRANANHKDRWYDGQLAYSEFDNFNYGVQLTAEKDTDGGKLTNPTQFVSALIFNGFTFNESSAIYEALGSLVQFNLRKIVKAEGFSLGTDFIDKFQKYITDKLVAQKSTVDADEVTKQVLARYGVENKLPYDDPAITKLVKSTIVSTLNKNAIREKLSGTLSVMSPTSLLIPVYDLPKGTLFSKRKTDGTLDTAVELENDITATQDEYETWAEINKTTLEPRDLKGQEFRPAVNINGTLEKVNLKETLEFDTLSKAKDIYNAYLKNKKTQNETIVEVNELVLNALNISKAVEGNFEEGLYLKGQAESIDDTRKQINELSNKMDVLLSDANPTPTGGTLRVHYKQNDQYSYINENVDKDASLIQAAEIAVNKIYATKHWIKQGQSLNEVDYDYYVNEAERRDEVKIFSNKVIRVEDGEHIYVNVNDGSKHYNTAVESVQAGVYLDDPFITTNDDGSITFFDNKEELDTLFLPPFTSHFDPVSLSANGNPVRIINVANPKDAQEVIDAFRSVYKGKGVFNNSSDDALAYKKDESTKLKYAKVARNKLVNFKKSLEMVAGRIPGQGMQSFMGVKVAFFHEDEKNSILSPPEMLFLQGSDFDIDKASVLGFTFDNNGDFVHWSSSVNKEAPTYDQPLDTSDPKLTVDGIKNFYVQKMFDVIMSPANYSSSQMPISFGETSKMASTSKTTDKSKLHKNSPSAVATQTEANSSGSAGIGVYATGLKVYSVMYLNWSKVLSTSYNTREEAFNAFDDMGYGNGVFEFGNNMKLVLSNLNRLNFNPETVSLFLNYTLTKVKTTDDRLIKKIEKYYNVSLNEVNGKWTSLEEGQSLSDVGDKPMKALYDALIKELIHEPKSDLELSALLSAATDNAKELILSKINANSATFSMYSSAVMAGIPIKEVYDILTSNLALDAMEVGKKNMFIDGSEYNSVKKGFSVVTGDFIHPKSKYHKGMSIPLEAINNKMGLKDLYKTMIDDPTDANVRLYANALKEKLSVYSTNEFEDKLRSWLKDDFSRGFYGNYIQIHKWATEYSNNPYAGAKSMITKYDKLNDLNDDTFLLGRVLSINQGIKNDPYTIYRLMTTINNSINDRYKKSFEDDAVIGEYEYDEYNNLIPEHKQIQENEEFNFITFLESMEGRLNDKKNPYYLKHIDKFGKTGAIQNILSFIQGSPHFRGLLNTLSIIETSNNKMFKKDRALDKVTTLLFNKGLIAGQYGNHQLTDNQFRELNKFTDEYIISEYLSTEQPEFLYKAPDGSITSLTLDDALNRSKLIRYVNNGLIPYLKENHSQYMAVQDMIVSKVKDDVTNKGHRLAKLKEDVSRTKTVSQQIAFESYKEDFTDMMDKDIQDENGNSVMDLLFYYNMIVYRNKPSKNSFTSVLPFKVLDDDGSPKTNILTEYYDFVRNIHDIDTLNTNEFAVLDKKLFPTYQAKKTNDKQPFIRYEIPRKQQLSEEEQEAMIQQEEMMIEAGEYNSMSGEQTKADKVLKVGEHSVKVPDEIHPFSILFNGSKVEYTLGYGKSAIAVTPVGVGIVKSEHDLFIEDELNKRMKRDAKKSLDLEFKSKVSNKAALNQIVSGLKTIYPNAKIHQLNDADFKELIKNDVRFKDFMNARAFALSGEVFINTDKASVAEPFHELTHVIMAGLKEDSPEFYNDLINEALTHPIREVVERRYKDLTQEELGEEIFATVIGEYAAKRNKIINQSWYENMKTKMNTFFDYVKSLFNKLFGADTTMSGEELISTPTGVLMARFADDYFLDKLRANPAKRSVSLEGTSIDLMVARLISKGIIKKDC